MTEQHISVAVLLLVGISTASALSITYGLLRLARARILTLEAMNAALMKQIGTPLAALHVYEGDAERNLQLQFKDPIVPCRICGRPVNEPGADVCGRTHA